MITNGYLLTLDTARLFEELKIFSVQITIDGSEHTHNARRFLKGGGATYQTILRNIEETCKCSPRTSICVRVNIDKTNGDDFFDVLSYFRKHVEKYPNVSVNPGFVNDLSGNDRNHCLYDKEAMTAFLQKAYYQHGYYDQCLYPANLVHVCAARNPNAVVIGPSGELYKCWNDVGNLNRSYGNVDGKMTNEDILYEYLIKADHLNDTKCNACTFFPVCDGGCPYQRIQNEKNGRPQDTCSLFKEYANDLLMLRYNHNQKLDNNNS